MKLTPIASRRTSTWPGAGWGVGTSSNRSASGPPSAWTRIAFNRASLLVHALQELLVGLGVAHLRHQEFHRLDRVQLVQELAQDPDALQHLGRHEQLFFAGTRSVDVDGREDSLVREFSV